MRASAVERMWELNKNFISGYFRFPVFMILQNHPYRQERSCDTKQSVCRRRENELSFRIILNTSSSTYSTRLFLIPSSTFQTLLQDCESQKSYKKNLTLIHPFTMAIAFGDHRVSGLAISFSTYCRTSSLIRSVRLTLYVILTQIRHGVVTQICAIVGKYPYSAL